MKRTRTSDENMIKWKKTGGGTFRLYNGKIVKKNEVFFAPIHLIPKAFRDTVKPVDKEGIDIINQEKKEVPLEGKSHVYSLQSPAKGWWNIVDGNGKVLNEKSLREAVAKEMLKTLESTHD
jgi:hypothetical protein